jgi:hypothetical protein
MPLFAEHARLKDHVTSMDGGLEAKIQEGFVFPSFFLFPFTFHHVCLVKRRSSALFASKTTPLPASSPPHHPDPYPTCFPSLPFHSVASLHPKQCIIYIIHLIHNMSETDISP